MLTLEGLNRDAALRIADRVPTRVLRPHGAGHEFGDAAKASAAGSSRPRSPVNAAPAPPH